MIFLFSFLFNLFLINESKIRFWEPEEIKNPLTNSQFCNVYFNQNSFICDPEDIETFAKKKQISNYLLHFVPQNTPCFCDDPCETYDYKRKLMIGIVIVSAINETIENCPKHHDVYDCFSAKILQNWNISLCSGNNALILWTKKQTHVYFGPAVHKRISITCLIKLKSLIRHQVPLKYNIRAIIKSIIQSVRKPCMCNDSCNYRHLKWLTNVVFFLGVIVLVTCIGGMSRRALVAKFHDRSVTRNNIFSNSFCRQRLIGVRPILIHDTRRMDTTADYQNPPDYSSIGPLPKPPPYIPNQDVNSPKIDTIQGRSDCTDRLPSGQTEDQPPAYSLIVGDTSSELTNPIPPSSINSNETHSNNNPTYQS